MNKIQIADEILTNTIGIYFKHFIKSYIDFVRYNENTTKLSERVYLVRFDQCLSYIEKSKFDTKDFGLVSILDMHVFCFSNRITSEFFDILVFSDSNIVPGCVTGSNTMLAKDIPEAINKYSMVK